MFKKLRRRVVGSVAGVAVALLSVTGSPPASADYNYRVTNPFMSLAAMIPDICFGSCLQFTGATALNTTNSILNEIQDGYMAAQELKSGPLGRLNQLGVLDPSGTNLLAILERRVRNVNPTEAGLACATAVDNQSADSRVDLASLFGVQQQFGVGSLSSGQIGSVGQLKVASALQAQAQCHAAEQLSAQANVKQAYANMGAEFDVNANPADGWIL